MNYTPTMTNLLQLDSSILKEERQLDDVRKILFIYSSPEIDSIKTNIPFSLCLRNVKAVAFYDMNIGSCILEMERRTFNPTFYSSRPPLRDRYFAMINHIIVQFNA